MYLDAASTAVFAAVDAASGRPIIDGSRLFIDMFAVSSIGSTNSSPARKGEIQSKLPIDETVTYL